MVETLSRPARRDREALGFLASLAFTGLAAVRDVYFGGLFQRLHPLVVAVVAFLLCTGVFLPVALVKSPQSFGLLARRPREVVWINATTALAWIAFFHALRITEPLLVQVLFSGIGPLSVLWIERRPAPSRHRRAERIAQLGLLTAIVAAAVIVLAGLSGGAPQPRGVAVLGVVLATFAGVSISVSTVICRRLNDDGVDPTALVATRFLGAVALAAVLMVPTGEGFARLAEPGTLTLVLSASLLLVVFPVYVNQVGIALASPLTVRVAMATGPVLIFVLQLLEGRLSSSPYSLGCAALYGVVAIAGAALRRRAIGEPELRSVCQANDHVGRDEEAKEPDEAERRM